MRINIVCCILFFLTILSPVFAATENEKLMIKAAYKGDVKAVQSFLLKGVNVNAEVANAATALYMASQNGHTNVVKVLLVAKANVDCKDSKHITPLCIASQNGHIDVVKVLLTANADVNSPDNEGATPLWVASNNGHADVVKALLAANADVNFPDNEGVTSLWIASQNGYTNVVKLLLNTEADINVVHKTNGATPLFIAALFGHLEVVQLLLAAGADVNKETNTGETPLKIAKKNGYVDIVNLLQETKYSGNSKYIYGFMAFLIAIGMGWGIIIFLKRMRHMSKENKRIHIGPFSSIFAGLVFLFTIFLFPTSEPGAVMIASTGKIVAKPNIVKLAPVFGRGRKNELYSFTLSPNVSKYAEGISPLDKVYLLATSVDRDASGNTTSDWSFAWSYWLLIDVVPSAILGCVILWILQRRQLKMPTHSSDI